MTANYDEGVFTRRIRRETPALTTVLRTEHSCMARPRFRQRPTGPKAVMTPATVTRCEVSPSLIALDALT